MVQMHRAQGNTGLVPVTVCIFCLAVLVQASAPGASSTTNNSISTVGGCENSRIVPVRCLYRWQKCTKCTHNHVGAWASGLLQLLPLLLACCHCCCTPVLLLTYRHCAASAGLSLVHCICCQCDTVVLLLLALLLRSLQSLWCCRCSTAVPVLLGCRCGTVAAGLFLRRCCCWPIRS